MFTSDKYTVPSPSAPTWVQETRPARDDEILKHLRQIERRLARMESRLCQLMLDQGSPIHLEDRDD